ncbi:hypothetical protein ACHAW6_004083 [Cyclotella cf. meneghiniana]
MVLQHRIPSLFLIWALFSTGMAFVPSQTLSTVQLACSSTQPKIALNSIPDFAVVSSAEIVDSTAKASPNLLALATLDPTTVLSDALGGLLGSSLILAVPIVAALAVAGLIAFFIVSYANPADED